MPTGNKFHIEMCNKDGIMQAKSGRRRYETSHMSVGEICTDLFV